MSDILDAPALLPDPDATDAVICSCVLVVDSHPIGAQRLALTLQTAGFRAVVCSLDDELDILEHVFVLQPHVVLLDPAARVASADLSPLVARLRSLGAEVIGFTDPGNARVLESAVRAGVRRIVSKAGPIADLLCALHNVESHSPTGMSQRASVIDELRRQRAEQQARLAPFKTLTRREAVVLMHMMRGLPAEIIATECFVSLATVRSQIRAVLTKLGVNTQLAAVAMAYQAGWAAEIKQAD